MNDLPRDLISRLEAAGPRPVLAWIGSEGRTELSGHVLANWVVKAVGHLADEVAAGPGDGLVLDLPPHWKRLVLALAGASLGMDVRIAPGRAGAATAPAADGPAGMLVVATDRPQSALAAEAEELLVLEAVSLSLRAPGALPPLARDWAQEVRASPDRLAAATGPWSGPDPAPSPVGPDPVMLEHDGADPHGLALALGAWLGGRGVIGTAEGGSAAG